MSAGVPIEPTAAPPPPATRTLAVVLREALEKGEEVRLIVAKALADSGQNANAYLNVELEGQQVTIPKVVGAGLGGSASGYPVYALATKDFMLAVGTVSASASPPTPLTVSALTVTGTATIGTLQVNGAATVNGNLTVNTDLYARDYYGRGFSLTGSGNMSGSLTVSSLTVNTDISCRDVYPRGVGASSDVTAQGWIQGGGIRQLNDYIRVDGNGVAFFGTATRGRYPGGPFPAAGSSYGVNAQTLINQMYSCLSSWFGLMS